MLERDQWLRAAAVMAGFVLLAFFASLHGWMDGSVEGRHVLVSEASEIHALLRYQVTRKAIQVLRSGVDDGVEVLQEETVAHVGGEQTLQLILPESHGLRVPTASQSNK